jgi:putative component of membrane protein insertase Oxa1/YidC/SpoIIIJ protein YidD
MDARVRSPLRRWCIRFIETYRADVSPRLQADCRFETSCSLYGLQAFQRHTVPVATAMTGTRLARCHRPGLGHRARRALAALGVAIAAIVGLPMLLGSAVAQVNGPCTATLNGVDANTAASPQDAIEVQHDAQVPATATMPTGPVAYKVQLEFSGIRWTVKTGTSSTNAWTSTVNIADYAKYGVGLYKVHAVSTNAAGQTCTVDGYVNVVGKSPLTTAAGVAGGVALVGGLAMTGAATAKAAKPPVEADFDVAAQANPGSVRTVVEATQVADAMIEDTEPAMPVPPGFTPVPKVKNCSAMVLMALYLTSHAMYRDRRSDRS